MQTKDALIVVDVQNDFCPGGALPVAEGDEIIPILNRYIDKFTKNYGRFLRDARLASGKARVIFYQRRPPGRRTVSKGAKEPFQFHRT